MQSVFVCMQSVFWVRLSGCGRLAPPAAPGSKDPHNHSRALCNHHHDGDRDDFDDHHHGDDDGDVNDNDDGATQLGGWQRWLFILFRDTEAKKMSAS